MSADQPAPPPAVPLWQQPWPVLLTGMGLAAAAAVLHHVWNDEAPVTRLLLLGSGLVLAGQAVVLRLRQGGGKAIEERVESAAVIALAGFTALIGILGIDRVPESSYLGLEAKKDEIQKLMQIAVNQPGKDNDLAVRPFRQELQDINKQIDALRAGDWDSAETVLRAVIIAAVCGVVLVLLYGQARRVAISLLILFHFGGILTAIAMIPPSVQPGAPASFLATKAWVHVYRHYLGFLFMNNAYHFYSPEPGPPTQFWFRLRYSNGDMESFDMPKREDSPVNLHYQRLLSVTALADGTQKIPAFVLEDRKKRRDAHSLKIPYHPDWAVEAQFQAPEDAAIPLIAAAVRRVARLHPHAPNNPSARLVSIKLYRVKPMIPSSAQMAHGVRPWDLPLHFAFYQGEFFPDGQLVNNTDPFLYWLVPIVPVPDHDPGNPSHQRVRNFMEEHAAADYNRKEREKAEKEKVP